MALSISLDCNDLAAQERFWTAWITLQDPEGNELCVEQVVPAPGRSPSP